MGGHRDNPAGITLTRNLPAWSSRSPSAGQPGRGYGTAIGGRPRPAYLGFDGVRVTEVAAACGVSEKTVFNYFPVKEALVMDRLEATLGALSAGLADPAFTPVRTALGVLDQELGAMTGWLAAQEDASQGREAIRRFGNLIRATPPCAPTTPTPPDSSTPGCARSPAPRARRHLGMGEGLDEG
jgi:tetracycline repressor-like protein